MPTKYKYMLSADAVITAQGSLAVELDSIIKLINNSDGLSTKYLIMQRDYVIAALDEFRALSSADAITHSDTVRDTFERDCV